MYYMWCLRRFAFCVGILLGTCCILSLVLHLLDECVINGSQTIGGKLKSEPSEMRSLSSSFEEEDLHEV